MALCQGGPDKQLFRVIADGFNLEAPELKPLTKRIERTLENSAKLYLFIFKSLGLQVGRFEPLLEPFELACQVLHDASTGADLRSRERPSHALRTFESPKPCLYARGTWRYMDHFLHASR